MFLKLIHSRMIALIVFSVVALGIIASCETKPPEESTGFKIGSCDWQIGKQCDVTVFELAAKLGLDGVQIDMGSKDDGLLLSDPQLQKQFLAESKKHDVEIASMAILAMDYAPLKSDPRGEKIVSDSIDVCQAMGVEVVLVPFFAGDLHGDAEGIKSVIEILKRLAPKAEKAGVVLGLESWMTAEENMQIINGVGSPAVQVYYDVGNSLNKGYDIYEEIRMLGKENICEFHAKDYGGVMGKGDVDFVKVRQAMDAIGYHGWIQWEGTQQPDGLEKTCRKDVEYLRTIFPAKL
jgi:L-ribulose-5-phosphate 3-epimerase